MNVEKVKSSIIKWDTSTSINHHISGISCYLAFLNEATFCKDM